MMAQGKAGTVAALLHARRLKMQVHMRSTRLACQSGSYKFEVSDRFSPSVLTLLHRHRHQPPHSNSKTVELEVLHGNFY